MRLINKKNLIFLTSILLVIISIFVFKQTKPIELDDVKLLEASNNTSFAMYKEDGEVYTEVEGNTFPEGYVLNINKSKCIDNNGNEIRDVLSYEDNQVKLTSNKTSYCYLYFDESLGLEIKNKNPNRLSTEVKGDMYRFQGQREDNVENYICFGTSDNCGTNEEDISKYMYRIIGIESKTGRVKVIKKEALDEVFTWWDNFDDEDIIFKKSIVYKAISGEKFLTNKTYIPDGWENKIDNNTWMYGDMYNNDDLGARQIGEELYKIETGQKETAWSIKVNKDEPGAKSGEIRLSSSPRVGETVYYKEETGIWNKTFDSKISLMYMNDYYLSVDNEISCQHDIGKYTYCQTGWMHLSQNDDNKLSDYELTMTRNGFSSYSGTYLALTIAADGTTNTLTFDSPVLIRPVFYIDASQKLKDGTGKIDDPFIIF